MKSRVFNNLEQTIITLVCSFFHAKWGISVYKVFYLVHCSEPKRSGRWMLGGKGVGWGWGWGAFARYWALQGK